MLENTRVIVTVFTFLWRHGYSARMETRAFVVGDMRERRNEIIHRIHEDRTTAAPSYLTFTTYWFSSAVKAAFTKVTPEVKRM